MELTHQFIEKLESNPIFLKKMLLLASEWQELNRVGTFASGPRDWRANDTVELTTVALGNDVIDEMVSDFGTAVVKEKAIAYLKGFITAISIMG